ncbi:MAG: hypothetical protein JWO44_1786 [Bacteroidetes bacterium]|nr:hypothetical protein [Bacteroidota bacterium]
MEDVNNYLKKSFSKLPLSQQNFAVSSYNSLHKGAQKAGDKVHPKYRLLYFEFTSLSKPLTAYLK